MGLKFKLAGIPITIQLWFIVITYLLWQMNGGGSAQQLGVWAAVVFTGVLLHELGHAVSGRIFGLTPNIDLHGFGGVTWWTGGRELTPKRSILVSFAGPAVGLVIGGIALVVAFVLDIGPSTFSEVVHWVFVAGPPEHLAEYTLQAVVWVNLGWGIFNLLPMMPLDGGNIMASFIQLFSKENGRRFARYVSFAVIALLGGWALTQGWIFMALFAAYFGWINFRAMRQEEALEKDGPLRPELERAYQALETGDVATATAAAGRVISGAVTAPMKAAAGHALAWARFLDGDLDGAEAALAALPQGRQPDPSLRGAILLKRGDPEGALRHLEGAMASGGGPFTIEQLSIALIRVGRGDEVVALFESGAGDKLGAEAVRRVQAAAEAAGEPKTAARIGAHHERRTSSS